MVAVFVIVKLIQRTFLSLNGFVLKTVFALIVLIYTSNFDLLSSIIHKIRETYFHDGIVLQRKRLSIRSRRST